MTMSDTMRRHAPLMVVLALSVALGLGYNVIVPVGESPDEPTHVQYVHYLRERHALPFMSEPGAGGITQGGHPPLYYAVAAALTAWAPQVAPERVHNPHFTFNLEVPQAPNAFVHVREPEFPYAGAPDVLAVHVMRLISLAAAVILIIATYALAGATWPDRPCLHWGAAAVAAFLPGFAFFSGVFNNDSLASAFGALAMVGAVRAALGHVSRRDLVLLGVVLGLGLLSKMTMVSMVGIAGVGIAIHAWRARDWRVLPRGAVYVGVPVVLLAGWWFVRTARLYGADDPLGWDMFVAAGPDLLRSVPLRQEIAAYWRLQFTTFWGSFGWTTIRWPEPVYRALAVLVLVALIGLGAVVARWRRIPGDSRWALALVGGTVVVGYVSVFRLALTFNMVVAHGRYLYAYLAPLAVLFATGISGVVPERRRQISMLALSVGMFALSLGTLLWLVRPAFALPRPLSAAEVSAVPHPVDAVYDGRLRLLGYRLSEESLTPGLPLVVKLYWQALPRNWEPFAADPRAEIAFVHVLGADGEVIGRLDQRPFGGTLPAATFPPGVTYEEEFQIPIGSEAVCGRGAILAGWYPEDLPNERLPVERDGQPAGDVVRIDVDVACPPEADRRESRTWAPAPAHRDDGLERLGDVIGPAS